jgi:ATP-dependent DNA ligase
MPPTKALGSGFVPRRIPGRAHKPPVGPNWVHEIKPDSYRLQVRRARYDGNLGLVVSL